MLSAPEELDAAGGSGVGYPELTDVIAGCVPEIVLREPGELVGECPDELP